VRDVFPKTLPNDVSASIGLAQLRKLEAHQSRRRSVWEHYQREFAGLGWLRTPAGPAADERHSYFTYFVRVVDGRRDALAHALHAQGIYTTLRYHPLHLNPIYRWPRDRALPNCELLNRQGLNLPLHPGLSDADVDHVVEAVKRF
jgi:dTDP-4-dehydro-2,3,6-trideoxy-D-glucose 4-aminotransferase